jgi:hypothetical protein
MPRNVRALRMYGQGTDLPLLDWPWVEERLVTAPLYWVVAASEGWPHSRPVWGVWHESSLFVSVGSPELRRAIAEDGRVTVHLESATQVVVIEGWAVSVEDESAAVQAYDVKYDYAYDVSLYGPLACIEPRQVFAWTTAGVAGRDGFRMGSAWSFDTRPE